jgi:hypothetical protein
LWEARNQKDLTANWAAIVDGHLARQKLSGLTRLYSAFGALDNLKGKLKAAFKKRNEKKAAGKTEPANTEQTTATTTAPATEATKTETAAAPAAVAAPAPAGEYRHNHMLPSEAWN